MAGINTILRLHDQMSAVLRGTIGVMNTVVNTAGAVETSTEKMMDSSSVQTMRAALQEVEVQMALMDETAEQARQSLGKISPSTLAAVEEAAEQTKIAVDGIGRAEVIPSGTDVARAELSEIEQQAAETRDQVEEIGRARLQSFRLHVAPQELEFARTQIERLHSFAAKVLGIRVFAETTGAERAMRRITDGRRWQTKIVPFIDTAEGERRLSALMEKFHRIRDAIGRNKGAQDRFNGSLRESVGISERLGGLIARLGLVYASIRGVKGFVGSADEYAGIHARLNLIKREGETIQGIQQATFDAARRSRGDYVQLSDIVSKMGLQAKDAFKSTAEVIAFSEQLQKNFAIAGTDQAGQSSVLYNLTQAMALGKLQGQDLRAVLSNIPQVGEMIARYMGESIGHVKELAKEGALSSVVVKNAVLAAAAETDAAFSKMPRTFRQIMTDVKNNFFRDLEGAQSKWLAFLNSDRFDKFARSVSRGFGTIATATLWAVERFADFTRWVTQADGSMKPWLKTVLTMIPVVYAWSKGIGAVKLAWDILSGAVLTNPIGAALAVTAGIAAYKFYQWADAVGGVGAAIEILRIKWDYNSQLIDLNFLHMRNRWDFVWENMEIRAIDAGMKIRGVIISMIVEITNAINSFLGMATQGINNFIFGMQEITGNYEKWKAIEPIRIGDSVYETQAQHEKELAILEKRKLAYNLKFSTFEADHARAADDLVTERERLIQKAKDDARPKGMDDALKMNLALEDIEKYTADMSGNTKDIKSKLGGAIDVENEDLKYLRYILTQRAINRFSFDKIVVQVDNQFGDVHESTDLDGWMTSLTDGLKEAVQTTVSGLSEAVAV